MSLVASTISCRKDWICGWGISSGSGSRPMQRKLLFPWTAAWSFSWNIAGRLLTVAACGRRGTGRIWDAYRSGVSRRHNIGDKRRETRETAHRLPMQIDVALLPGQRFDPARSVCVVVDVLRASSSIVTLLERGAESVVAAGDIEGARKLAERLPGD